MAFGLADQHVIGERNADQVGQSAAIFDAADRLQSVRRPERHRRAGIGVAAPAAVAGAATDLERNDDEIAGREILHLIADGGDAAGGLVPERKRTGQPRSAVDDRKIEIAARHRERLHQRVAIILQMGLGNVPPFDLVAADISQLPHRVLSALDGECREAGAATKGLSSTEMNGIHLCRRAKRRGVSNPSS